jgi:hypothetical protein
VGGFEHAIHAPDRPRDLAVAELPERQHGVVAYRQLVELGLGRGAIQCRVAKGRLHPLHVGVFAVGHRGLSSDGRLMAAVMCCGPGAMLSHRSAADRLGILPSFSNRIDVAAPRTRSGGHPGISLHRPRRLVAEDCAVEDGIAVTSLPRTLLDLAEGAQQRHLRRALDESERLGLFDLRAVERLIGRSRGHRGVRRLTQALEDYVGPPPITRSALERRFLDLCYEGGLPRPQANVLVEGREVDVFWPEHQLIVELDGHAYHHTRAAFEGDRKRDAELQTAGYRVLRITQRRLEGEPEAVTRTVRALLSPSPERPGGALHAGARALPAAPAS